MLQQDHHRRALTFYIIGFILALILTFGAFGLVMNHSLPAPTLFISMTAFVVLQLIVQVIFFLRLNRRTEAERWNVIAFVFTLLVMAILIGGSLWIMYNLNYNMSH